MIVSRMVRGWVAAGMLVAALVGCATTETQPSASVTSPKMSPAARYRVTVWAYDRIKGGGSG